MKMFVLRHVARGLCAAIDPAYALFMVSFDSEWNAYPGNITNLADVANGDPPNFRARPTYTYGNNRFYNT